MLQWMQESLLPGLLEPYRKAISGSYCNSVVISLKDHHCFPERPHNFIFPLDIHKDLSFLRLLKLIYVKNDDNLLTKW